MEDLAIINIGRSMQCDHGVGFWLQSQLPAQFKSFSPRAILDQRVDHDIADKVDPVLVNTFGQQIIIGHAVCRE